MTDEITLDRYQEHLSKLEQDLNESIQTFMTTEIYPKIQEFNMTVLEALEKTGNTEMALELSKHLLHVYETCLAGCSETEQVELKEAFRAVLSSAI